MAPIQVDPQEFGAVKALTEDNGKKLDALITKIDTFHDMALTNKINIRWVWLAVCGLGGAFGAGFAFLFALITTT